MTLVYTSTSRLHIYRYLPFAINFFLCWHHIGEYNNWPSNLFNKRNNWPLNHLNKASKENKIWLSTVACFLIICTRSTKKVFHLIPKIQCQFVPKKKRKSNVIYFIFLIKNVRACIYEIVHMIDMYILIKLKQFFSLGTKFLKTNPF